MAVIPAHAVVAVIPAHAGMAVIPAHAVVAVFQARVGMAVIPAHAVVAVIPAHAGIHGCASRRSSCRDVGLPAPRQPLPGGGSHWGGLR